MAGHPKRMAFYAYVDEHGLEDEIFEWIASGESPERIARKLGTSRRMLYHWRDQEGHKEERQKRWSEAMAASGDAHVERARALLQRTVRKGGAVTSPHVSAVSSLVNFEKWLAGVKNPAKYGEKSAATVNVNIGQLHLDALRLKGNMGQQHLTEGAILDAELLPAGDEDDEAA